MPEYRISLAPRNPGQFFACCGLFELAGLIAPGAEAAFGKDGADFVLHGDAVLPPESLALETQPDLHDKPYDATIEPIDLIVAGKKLKLNWWLNETLTGKSALKTWGGQQTPRRVLEELLRHLDYSKPFDGLFNTTVYTKSRFGVDARSAWDALARSTSLAGELREAFAASASGNAETLAKIAPTTLVFGAWDSRGTQAKVPRLIDSTIRAYQVAKLRRGAQYVSALENEEIEQLMGVDIQTQREQLSQLGFLDAPSLTYGGVIVKGDIVRTTVMNLTALRALGGTVTLRRYILGLTLVAALAPADLFLRQGCLLVSDPKREIERTRVYRDGRSEPFSAATDVEAFAKAAAEAFVVGESRVVDFDAKAANVAHAALSDKRAPKKTKRGVKP